MSTHTFTPRTNRSRLLVFAPTLICLSVVAFIASGASIVPGANAVTAIGVTGTVNSTFTVDPGTTGGGGVTGCADESIGTTFAATAALSNGCSISMTSNAANGVTVKFDNNYAAANDANGFFCADADFGGAAARDCGGVAAPATRVPNLSGTNNTLGANSFGLALLAVAGDGGISAGTGAPTANPAPTATDPVWNEIHPKGSGTPLCATTGPNTTGSTCDFKFGGRGNGAAQGAGDYSGSLRLVTSQN